MVELYDIKKFKMDYDELIKQKNEVINDECDILEDLKIRIGMYDKYVNPENRKITKYPPIDNMMDGITSDPNKPYFFIINGKGWTTTSMYDSSAIEVSEFLRGMKTACQIMKHKET